MRYAPSRGGIDIAYQVVGDGPVDLVYASGFITHLDLAWDLPHIGWLQQLDGVARVLVFDKRGTGLSDRSLGFGSVEERADDLRAVMDAAGSERAVLMGISEGGPLSIVAAASMPDRVLGLVLYGTAPRISRADDYPLGLPADLADRFLEFVRDRWGTGEVFATFMQNPVDPDAARRLLARFERNACTPQMAVEIMRRNLELDVRPLLGAIRAPTLVVHCAGDPVIPVASGRYLAEHIPDARFVELPGAFHGSWRPTEMAPLRDAVIAELARGGAPTTRADRVLATVVFTDIVSSTEVAGTVGDGAWHTMLDQHDRTVRAEIERFGGRMVKTTGDGVLATFDGPGRGIAAAASIADVVGPLGLGVRAGVHTGEIERRGDDIAGMGVVIARRVCDLADAGQILVTRTVKELVTGSGTAFSDGGTHHLKGVPDEWQLFAVR